jgi:predicted ribosomally synthesized peptide with SipW-like signal peptide
MRDVNVRVDGKKLVILGITAIAVVSLSAGAMSLALFTDDVDVGNNGFTTGTVDLTASPASALFSVSAMMPGDSDYGQLTVSNSGTAQLRYSMTTSATDPDSLSLGSALALEIREKATGSCSADFTGTVVLSSTALDSAAVGDPTAGAQSGDRTLDPTSSEDLCFKVSLPLGTANSYQGATTTATFSFHAEQTANNP